MYEIQTDVGSFGTKQWAEILQLHINSVKLSARLVKCSHDTVYPRGDYRKSCGDSAVILKEKETENSYN